MKFFGSLTHERAQIAIKNENINENFYKCLWSDTKRYNKMFQQSGKEGQSEFISPALYWVSLLVNLSYHSYFSFFEAIKVICVETHYNIRIRKYAFMHQVLREGKTQELGRILRSAESNKRYWFHSQSLLLACISYLKTIFQLFSLFHHDSFRYRHQYHLH